mmetsp:Transcript_20480/g.48584  ORF Transcript_20480/g.48584 Transcript_20480/m.48584 type:complete len:232 (+) Transcript_20480:316-1011(+)
MSILVIHVTSSDGQRVHPKLGPHITNLPEQKRVGIKYRLVFGIHAFRLGYRSFNVIRNRKQLLQSIHFAKIFCSRHGLVMAPAIILQIGLHSEKSIHDLRNFIFCLVPLLNHLGFFCRGLRSPTLVAFRAGRKIHAAAIQTFPFRGLLLFFICLCLLLVLCLVLRFRFSFSWLFSLLFRFCFRSEGEDLPGLPRVRRSRETSQQSHGQAQSQHRPSRRTCRTCRTCRCLCH